MVDQVDFVVVEVQDSVAVVVEVAAVPVPVPAAAVDDEGMTLAALQVPQAMVVRVFVPEERIHSVAAFRADRQVINNKTSMEGH